MFERTGLNKYDLINIGVSLAALGLGVLGLITGHKANIARCNFWRDEYNKFIPPSKT